MKPIDLQEYRYKSNNAKEKLDTYFRLCVKEGKKMRVMIDYLNVSFFDVTSEEISIRILGMEKETLKRDS